MELTVTKKWKVVEKPLIKAGVDTSKIAPLHQAMLLAQLEADEVIGEDQEIWNEWVDGLLEDHPGWATPKHNRLRNAIALIDGWHESWDDPDSDPVASELAEHKYAVLAWYDGNSHIYGCGGDTLRDVLETVCGLTYEQENDEYVESYIDLDTGEKYPLREAGMTTVITMTLNGEEYTKVYGGGDH